MKIFKFFVLGFCLLLSSELISGDEFPFTPPSNFTLTPEYIGLHHPVTANNRISQLYFDQGLTFIYAFNHDAAYWSFLKASENDPNMGMAYWGMALALGTNINMEMPEGRVKKTDDLVQKALQLSQNLPQNEKDYIDAISKRYSPNPNADRAQLALNYSQAMEALSKKYPEDPDASVLYAESILDLNPWHQWSLDGKPLKGTLKAVNAIESVLKSNPNHLGANHYYIHAIEASKHPERALMAAQRLKTLLPSSGHILHMPSHIFILVGDYHQAALSNEAAITQDLSYIRKYGLYGIYPGHYLTHNFFFLSRAYTMEGNFSKAMRAAQDLTDFYTPLFKSMPELEYYASGTLFNLIQFHKWKLILDRAPPPEEMKMTNTLWHFDRAIAFAKLGNREEALKEQSLFDESKKQLPPELRFGYNVAGKILIIANYFLDATFAENNGNTAKAIDALKLAIKEQDALNYNEPPDWAFPIREYLGNLYLQIKQFPEAEIIFREDLTIHPRNGRALFGLKESLAAQQKMYDYYWVDQAFQKAWLYSDTSLK